MISVLNLEDNNAMIKDVRINVIVNIIRTLVLTLLSFITFPWVCRYLGDSTLGLYTWANTFVAYFLILAKIGIPNLAIRECVKVRDNKELLSNKVQTFFLLQLITTLLSFIFLLTLTLSIPELRDSSSLIFILSLNFLSGAFSFEWLFIALEKQFYMSVRSIIVLTLTSILIIVFVTNQDDVYIYSILTVSVTILTTICNLVYSRKFISYRKTLPYEYKQYIKPLIVLGSLSFILSIYNQTDTFILGLINQDKKEVASYSVGIKGVDIIIGILTSLSTVFIPRAAYCWQKEDKKYFNNLTKYSVNICVFIVLPAIATMSILAKPICGLISGNYSYNNEIKDYSNAPYILMILASMMFTYSICDIIYGQILLPMKKEKYYLLAILVGSLLNIILSVVLGLFVFKNNPSLGVAIGTSITDILILVYLLSKTWKYSKQAIFNKNSLKILVATCVVVAVSLLLYNPSISLGKLFIKTSSGIMIFQLLFIVIIDAIIYLIILIILKENLISSFIRKKKTNE